MKASDLNSYFNNSLSLERFFESLVPEISEYTIKLSKLGSSANLYFEEDQDIYLNKGNLNKILSEVPLEKYHLNALAYIFDCLTLEEKVHYTDAISTEMVFDLADDEICKNLDSQERSRLLSLLK